MRKRQSKIEKEAQDNGLSVESYLSLMKSIEDFESPIRYVLVSNLFGTLRKHKRWRMFFRVEDDTWTSDLGSATLFRRKHYAVAIRNIYIQEGNFRKKVKKNYRLVVAKITTKSNRRKVLRYYTEE